MSETIGSILKRDLTQAPEEVIKLDQSDAAVVRAELTEYVATDTIRRAYQRLFRAMAEAPNDPQEGVGVWVSGFFGSGKSSFAKNLGYALANRRLGEHHASELLLARLNDPTSASLVASLQTRVKQVEVVMFDVNLDRSDAGQGRTLSISSYLYVNLLRSLGYSDDPRVADLEFSLEQRGVFDRFVAHFEDRLRAQWAQEPERYERLLTKELWRWTARRGLPDALSLASTRMHELDPANHPTADHLLHAMKSHTVEVTPKFLVERAFALMEQRRPGAGLAFVVDEVGGYVARSADRIEDLRVVVEHFGKEGRNRVKARRFPAPVWMVITAQEKLDAVVDYLDSKRVELARLQDRFPAALRVDLEPSDIEEVVSQRVLAKTDAGEAALKALFAQRGPEINERLRLERTHHATELDAARFARFYPYPPHFLSLSVEVVNNLRTQDSAGNSTVAGGSNRTLIRQAYAMLATAPRGGEPMKDRPVGALVTFDRICDLVWSNLSSEQHRELGEVEKAFGAGGFELRVAKTLVLTQQLRNLPRTEANLAALLWEAVGAPSPLDAVRRALTTLKDANFVRLGDQGWTLQTQAEKDWSTRKRSIDPRPGELSERLRDAVTALFDEDPALRAYTFRVAHTLRLAVTMDDHPLVQGTLPLHLVTAPAESALRGGDGVLGRVWSRSNEPAGKATAWWVWARDARVDELLTALCQSERIVKIEEPKLHGKGAALADLRGLVDQERAESSQLSTALQRAVRDALGRGVGVFRGVERTAAELGGDLPTALGAFLGEVVPQLYPYIELKPSGLRGTEAEEILKSAALTGLPEVYYAPPKGLDLVAQKEGRWAVNPEAPVARLVLAHLRARHGYGEKVTGKDLEAEFTGVGYAWSVELVQLALAALLRGGHIEVLHQGTRFASNQAGDPRARQPFALKPAFRAASFAPRTTPGTRMLVKAATQYEALTGDEVDIEEGAIAERFHKVAQAEHDRATPALAVAAAMDLPIAAELREAQAWWRNAAQGASDDAVKLLAEEGADLVARRKRLARAVDALSGERVAVLRRARDMQVRGDGAEGELAEALSALREALSGDGWIDEPRRFEELAARAEAAWTAQRARIAAEAEARRRAAEEDAARRAEAERAEAERVRALAAVALTAVAQATIARVEALPAGPVVLRDAGEVEDFVTSLRERLLDALRVDGAVQVE